MKEPLLSIIILSYENSSLVLRRALRSVMEQSYENCELLLVDANEKKSEYSLGLREDMERYPDIPVISCPSAREEFAAAKNEGAAQANGTYLAFLMAEDAWNQECAASQIEVLEEHPDVALVFCQRWLQDEDALSTGYRTAPETAPGENGRKGLLTQEAIHSVSQVIFRRSAFEEMLGFDTHINRQDEYDMWIRLSRKYRIASIDQNLVCGYVDRELLRKTRRLISVVGYLQLYSKHYDMYRRSPQARLELFRKIAACYKNERYYVTWLKYAAKIKGLEMRIGKRKETETAPSARSGEGPAYQVISQQDKEYIAVVKHLAGGGPGPDLPEPGAEFIIWLKSAGSYEAATANERDILVCNEEGYARSRGLSQGIYTVRQTKSPSGAELAGEFEVRLERSGKTHTISVSSAPEGFYVKVERRDRETGQLIPLPGGSYRILDQSGTPVSMDVVYPEPMRLDRFAAGEKGWFVTPEKLPPGSYSLEEGEAPFGYVKGREPVRFSVSKENGTPENGAMVVTVAYESTRQMGKVLLRRSGPVNGRVAVSDGGPGGIRLYRPYFEEGPGAGAVYEIAAEEDIVAADGTVRAEKGRPVAVLTTGADGSAASGLLYPGAYRITEKKAPFGLTRAKEGYRFSLEYDQTGQPCTETVLSFDGARQKASVRLEITPGGGQAFGAGENRELEDFAFGLFAAEKIELTGGSSIPEDGLVEVLACDREGKACSRAELPFGSYYVRMLTAGSHYRRSDTRYPVYFAYQDQDAKETELTVNGGRPVPVEMKRGTVSGVQTDFSGRPLAMAEIGLFAMGAPELSREKALLVSCTDQNGRFSFRDIPCGEYIVRELRPPQGYRSNEAMYFVELALDGQEAGLKLLSQSRD